ncbi:MAG: hypothetical protein A3B74_03490 [Candidatus Kerfeldbacteria bacterium RIFCSPHIGHO2_02_FULL_42_14]|uniref:Uncharacterized protein n=1 Tax=Candidatus Kerfeldbacteria bacterium RIFCSPHIGHO2_02_FULL_42_14 TaxID=1798540 RepID=A0A1G2AT06_9BACT|nr:MAG: hypothetical protein A3B74_03490 [Candidatus Kerfeldbacteria bacterium RIFCSPHIGHO2_02_FULL_42_14]OGY84449.1 MAG: hypothetical protein A3I91_00005 [Candidatus Kerfeldbacteria bacterium RIFCSPLOWO2_02_FULL_42_19]OGY86451.1 MAG: hypothetical protein A3G01_00140 [Candidatus Kerfeldbacteria bacterium RIFCSPLOWO2_12_FULL_43_9]
MSLLKPQRIEDFIITLLAQGSLKNSQLLAELSIKKRILKKSSEHQSVFQSQKVFVYSAFR